MRTLKYTEPTFGAAHIMHYIILKRAVQCMQRLAVCNAQDDSLSIICPQTLRETRRIELPRAGRALGPRRCCADGNGRIWCVLSYVSEVLRIDARGMETLSVGAYPIDVCLLKGAEKIFVACGETNSIFCIDTAQFAVECSVPVCDFPNAIQYDAQQARLIVPCIVSGGVSLLSAPDLQLIKRIRVPGTPYFAAFHPDGTLYVSHAQQDSLRGAVSAFDADGGQRFCVPADTMPGTIRFSKSSRMAVVAQTGSKCLLIVDCFTGSRIRKVFCGGMPDDVLLCEARDRMFVSCMQDNALYVYNMDFKFIKRIPTGREPRGLCLFEES